MLVASLRAFLLRAGQAPAMPHAVHTDAFLPHGYCYLWDPALLWTHLTSDMLIGTSYVVISVALAALVHRARRDIPFSAAFIAFGLFIITCGMTHFMEVWTLWHPAYWLAAYVKAVTAVASVSTAAVMPFMLPRVHATIRDARLSRAREVDAARLAALEESHDALRVQALAIERQREEAQALAQRLEQSNDDLRRAIAVADEARLVAEQANRSKSDFLATMSHELRTPLNAIGGYAQLLELGTRGPVTDEQRLDLGRIRKSQLHLQVVINDILDFAHLANGTVTVQLEAVAPIDVVAAAADLLTPLFRRSNVTFVATPCAPDVKALADADKLRQVVFHLLSNAGNFTPAGGRITASCEATAHEVRLLVSDTGIGIAAEKQETIFEPFVQLDRTLSRQVDGTGLGLSISRDLARAMGGDISVESALGQGATFIVRLPRATSAA
ncbi:MAG: HAMP domain-containing sensor histidine kinase [bacterium]